MRRLLRLLAWIVAALALTQGRPVVAHALPLLLLAGTTALGHRSTRSGIARFRRFLPISRTPRRADAALLARLAALCRVEQPARQQTRVARLVVFLAREAGYGAKTADLLATASSVHRIGHVSCPPDPLGELPASAQAHCAASIAVRLLAGQSDLHAAAAAMAAAHQERWDGTGLPCGLSGAEIPLPARLLQVALVLEQMMADTVLTTGALAQVADRLEAQAGLALDPALAVLPARNLPALHRLMTQLPVAHPQGMPARTARGLGISFA